MKEKLCFKYFDGNPFFEKIIKLISDDIKIKITIN